MTSPSRSERPLRLSELAGSAELLANQPLHETESPVVFLPGGNRYNQEAEEYCTDHLPLSVRRDAPEYWELHHQERNGYQSLPRRRGNVLETLNRYSRATGRQATVAVLSAGAGRECADIADVSVVQQVHAIDFSTRVSDSLTRQPHPKLQVYQCTNKDYLECMTKWGREVDVILAHGGVFENNPTLDESHALMRLAAQTLRPGGILWTVGLVQPALNGASYSERVALDVPGMYCHPVGSIAETPFSEDDQMSQVARFVHTRTHVHPGISLQGEETEARRHGHTIERAAWIKDGVPSAITHKYQDVHLIGSHLQ